MYVYAMHDGGTVDPTGRKQPKWLLVKALQNPPLPIALAMNINNKLFISSNDEQKKRSAPKESVDERKTNIYLNRRKKSAILAKGMDCATKVFYCICSFDFEDSSENNLFSENTHQTSRNGLKMRAHRKTVRML